MVLEIILLTLLVGGLFYFLFDSTAIFICVTQWTGIIVVLIFLGFVVSIGFHFAKIVFGW